MNKVVAIIVVMVVLAFALMGCGGTEPASSPQEAVKPVVDVHAIANKSQSEIITILGEPLSTEKETATYANGVEVFYVSDKAAKITITPEKSLPYTDQESVLQYIGVKREGTYKEGPISTVYHDIDGLYEISVFKDQENVSYIYVIADESYDN